MHAFMVQQARFQQEMYEMQARANHQKQKANPPKFQGRADDDLELWLFHIEEHFATYTVEQSSNDSTWLSLFWTWTSWRGTVSGTQQEYSTKFMQLLSMSSIDMPEIVKRWFYQQNLRAETNSYVSQNSPLTLKDTIERVQRFEDAHEAPKAK
ncbi:hypothetical protein Pcac1_g9415 [Phytophthora cactorum]|uniref:Retrotransposon gag domain-containing protein n=2 Tax=Phytophthora cactorum TaxID=29920 RepID=A0A329S1F0_9STRA|nr:hypothetical protein Pcac1_g9415 [Phytophthora cactorum]KAG3003179.1 hypothetical protein PC119_g16103 [Phytophthora cactorum]KAG3073788.1 hypothetical protein PC122_g14666 [Phytophthora cactorum]RAW29696.1 hypothetical protein PC110_g13934 [Phytophthora cactorum]